MEFRIIILILKVNKLEKANKLTITPISSTLGGEKKKSIKLAIEHVIATKTPLAARLMMSYVRESYGAASVEYAQILIVLNDLNNDRIHNKKELVRRVYTILNETPLDERPHVDNLITDLWLVD